MLFKEVPFYRQAMETDDAAKLKAYANQPVIAMFRDTGFEGLENLPKKPFPLKAYKNIVYWVVTENAVAVGFNRNMARGYSYPVTRYMVRQ